MLVRPAPVHQASGLASLAGSVEKRAVDRGIVKNAVGDVTGQHTKTDQVNQGGQAAECHGRYRARYQPQSRQSIFAAPAPAVLLAAADRQVPRHS